MSANSSLAIRIAAIFDNKGLKQAGKEVKGLQSAVKKLAGAAGIGLSTAAVVNFGKQASKAFIADEKAASQLALSVKNLGLAFETPRIEEFISQLSKASGVTDDQLRPSMQKLLQTTGSVKKSTELLTQALDISRGSGIAYETVVQDLSSAYVGQTRGLRKYNLGLSVAELKTMSFTDVQAKLTKQFTGANAAYLETYAGKMGILSTAAGEAQEIIGKGLVDSLSILAGEGNTVQPLADSMQDLATYVSDVITGLATMIAEFKKLPGVQKYVTEVFPAYLRNTPAGALLEIIKGFAPKTTPGMGGYPSSALGGTFVDPNEAARKAAEAAAAKRAKELAALQKKTLNTQKQQLALTKAGKTLDIERIGITAALRNQVSETDRLSLNLQLALLDKNEAAASKLSGQLDAAVKRQNELAALLLATPKAPNPYEAWKIPDEILNWAAASLSVSKEILLKDPASIAMPETDAAREMLEAFIDGQKATEKERMAQEQADTIVKLYIDGDELTSSITKSQTNQSLSGSFNQVNRSGRFENIAV